jgi:hypothetical protein
VFLRSFFGGERKTGYILGAVYTLGAGRVYQMKTFTHKVQLSQKEFPKTPPEKGLGGKSIGKLFKNEITIGEILKTSAKSAAKKISSEKN